MTDKYQKLKQIFAKRLKENEPLAKHTTFKIGGPARFYFEAQNQEDLLLAVRTCFVQKIPYFILGGGANLLVSDQGFEGLVIKNKTEKIKVLKYQGKVASFPRWQTQLDLVLIEADSGVILNKLVRFTLEEGFAGLECFLGLPGTVGGAIFMNAHFQDQFVGDRLGKAKILTPQGEEKEVAPSYFRFGYDQSILQKTGEILLAAIFKLKSSPKEILWQKAMTALKRRLATQPQGLPSAGSVFKRISQVEAWRLGTPNFTQSAGFLIEACGLKGKKIGQAQISPSQANFIVNLGRAQSSDVVELISLAKQKVKEKFNLDLEEEIIYVGNFTQKRKIT